MPVVAVQDLFGRKRIANDLRGESLTACFVIPGQLHHVVYEKPPQASPLSVKKLKLCLQARRFLNRTSSAFLSFRSIFSELIRLEELLLSVTLPSFFIDDDGNGALL
jgi:hypothetical protein